MPANPNFRLIVEEVFGIHGKGTVVAGWIASGTVHVGDEVYLKRQDSARKTVVMGIKEVEQKSRQAQEGQYICVLLRDIDKGDVQCGDSLMGSGGDVI